MRETIGVPINQVFSVYYPLLKSTHLLESPPIFKKEISFFIFKNAGLTEAQSKLSTFLLLQGKLNLMHSLEVEIQHPEVISLNPNVDIGSAVRIKGIKTNDFLEHYFKLNPQFLPMIKALNA